MGWGFVWDHLSSKPRPNEVSIRSRITFGSSFKSIGPVPVRNYMDLEPDAQKYLRGLMYFILKYSLSVYAPRITGTYHGLLDILGVKT